MRKYIDVKRIREELERLEEIARTIRVSKEHKLNEQIGADGQIRLIQSLNNFLDTLEKEQENDTDR